jgi:Chlororespiratory reduction 6
LPEAFKLDAEPVVIIVSRDEVVARDISSVIETLKCCLTSPERVLSLFEKLDIAFHGYDEDARELFEIEEVREFVVLLDQKFPYWLFFLTKNGLGLQAVTLCFMPPYLPEQARKTIFPERLQELMSNRWLPAMNQICGICGFTDEQMESLTNRVINYFTNGPNH